MRLGLIIYGSLDIISGGYLYDRVLVEYLRAQGDTVEIISLPWRSYPVHLAHNLSASLYRRLRNSHFDVLLQDELNHPSLWHMNERLRGPINYPILSIVHHLRSSEREHPPILRPLYRAVERRYLRSVDSFIFNSYATRSAVESLSGESKPNVVAHPAGDRLGVALPADQIARRVETAARLEIVFLGNLIPRKGLHTLLDALAHLPSQSWYLTIIGSADVDRAYTRLVRRQIAALDLSTRVTFLHAASDEMLVTALSTSHVMAVPSSYEGFGIAYLEGMAFGLPAIATTGGAAGEIIAHGETGFLISPGDVASLAGCLRLLLEDRPRLLAMSLAARQRFDHHPTWAQTAARIRAFIQRMQRVETAVRLSGW